MARPRPVSVAPFTTAPSAALLGELAAHFRQNRARLRDQWVGRIARDQLLTAMSKEEIGAEAAAVYDAYLDVLETDSAEAIQEYAHGLSERFGQRAVETHEVIGLVLLLRDVLARELSARYGSDPERLAQVVDEFEPAANRIAATVGASLVLERERVIREQQETIRELSAPVLALRRGLLVLPIIGALDPQRARQLTERLLAAVRTYRARVAVVDVTRAPAVDGKVAMHLVQTVAAARLLGATVILTGLSPENAQILVTVGVDLARLHTAGDVAEGLRLAEDLLHARHASPPRAAAG